MGFDSLTLRYAIGDCGCPKGDFMTPESEWRRAEWLHLSDKGNWLVDFRDYGPSGLGLKSKSVTAEFRQQADEPSQAHGGDEENTLPCVAKAKSVASYERRRGENTCRTKRSNRSQPPTGAAYSLKSKYP